MFLRSLSSEFPHDNPALSEGVVWTCPSPCARAYPLREPDPPPAGALVFGPPGALSALTAAPSAGAVAKPKPIAAARPRAEPEVPASQAAAARETAQPADAFSRLLHALSEVLLHAGATRIAASLPALFATTRDAASIDGMELDAVSRELIGIGGAWRDVLSGASSDLNACGTRTLDEWGADLLCALMRRPRSETRDLRQKLRARGVAAFGLRDAA